MAHTEAGMAALASTFLSVCDNCLMYEMCIVDNFKQFLSKVADVSQSDLPDNFSYGDSIVLELLKFAEIRVSQWLQGKTKTSEERAEMSVNMQVVPWVSIVRCKMKSLFTHYILH